MRAAGLLTIWLMLRLGERRRTTILYLLPLLLSCAAAGLALHAVFTSRDTILFSDGISGGISVERWAMNAILLIPIMSVLWSMELMRRRNLQLAEPTLREELATTLLAPRAYLGARLRLPLVALLAPFLISFPFYAGILHRITHTIFIKEQPEASAVIIGEREISGNPSLRGWLDGYRSEVHIKYDWANLGFLLALGLSIVFIALAAQYASLARLCQRRSRPAYSLGYFIAWTAMAILIPHFGSQLLNGYYLPGYIGSWHSNYWWVAETSPLFATNPHARVFVWGLTVFWAGYAAFWWRRLCAIYYRLG